MKSLLKQIKLAEQAYEENIDIELTIGYQEIEEIKDLLNQLQQPQLSDDVEKALKDVKEEINFYSTSKHIHNQIGILANHIQAQKKDILDLENRYSYEHAKKKEYETKLNAITELVERATPREVKIHFRNNIPIAYTCYICDTKTRHFGQLFCLECGQALKWSDSE